MTLELVQASFTPHVRTDRVSQELRAYVRSEWRGDAPWLRREAARPSLLTRLRAWRDARRSASRTPSADAGAPSSPVGVIGISAPVEPVEDCPHPETEELGLSGGAVFLQCVLCGDVLVSASGQMWKLGPASSADAGERIRL